MVFQMNISIYIILYSMAKEQKVYMPLMIGDWLKGTRGMKAEVRGVYINLLLFQWDNGFIPSDMDELCLIDPELPKVWDKLKDKFSEAGKGKLKNLKNDEVKAFWAKQRKNGQKGGKPTKHNPVINPEPNPRDNPKANLHNDIDYDSDNDLKNKKEFDFSKPDINGDEIVFPIDTQPVRELWALWKKYRWEAHESRYGMMGEQADLKRLEKMDFARIEKTILTAIANNWKNLYPDSNGTKTNQNGKGTSVKADQSRATSDYLADYYSNKAQQK